jgi:hypothetical protein
MSAALWLATPAWADPSGAASLAGASATCVGDCNDSGAITVTAGER